MSKFPKRTFMNLAQVPSTRGRVRVGADLNGNSSPSKGHLSWIIGGLTVCIRLILLVQNNHSLQRLYKDVTSPHFFGSSHLPKSASSSLKF